MLLAAAGLAAIGPLADHEAVLLLLPAFLAFGIARPLATVAATAGTVGAIPREARGLSSALVTQSRKLGAVLGVAVLGLVLTGFELAERDRLLRGVDASFSSQSREALDGILADSDAATSMLAGLPPGVADAAREAAAAAYISGFRAAMLVAASLAAAAGIATLVLLPRATSRATGPAPARRRSSSVM